MLQLTASNFQTEVKSTSQPVVVLFYASWCNKCAMMRPVVEDMEKKYHQIKFCKVDIETSSALAQRYKTDIVPTFVFFLNGQIQASFSGIIDEEVFEQRIKKIFRNC